MADGVTLRMVLEKYDARKVRAHVRRFRDVLSNPPIPQAAEAEAETPADSDKAQDKPEKEAEGEAADEKKLQEISEQQLKRLREIHQKLEGVEVPVKVDLADFYAFPGAVAEAAAPVAELPAKSSPTKGGKKSKGKGKNNAAEDAKKQEQQPEDGKLPSCIKSIVFSGYNPPPGPRKLAGDLLYLEVTTADGSAFHVTASVNGFYVNRSTATKFDPLPGKFGGHNSHLLLDVLRKASESFKRSYESLLAKAATLAKQGPSSIEWMVAAGNNIGGKLPWNSPVKPGDKHEYDLNRAEDELTASYGMDERGVLRDWNEEYQCCRELPATSLKEQIVRSRVMYKIVNEFVDAATQGAVAIVEGHIPPINPMDDTSAHVYVFNNIFFSMSIDGKSAPKDAASEEAAYSAANRDLLGVKAFNDADVPGLHTLATTIVDYMGVRVIAQSVIPGILQGEAASKLVYGSVDGGKTIASNPKMHALMLEAGEKLHIAERSIKPLGKDEDEEAASAEDAAAGAAGGEAGTEIVKLCGPVEAKGILGSDGRMYVLDLVRTTPKDATFYDKEAEKKETSEQEGLRFAREDEGYVAVLRPELVQLFSLWKQNQVRRERREARKAAAEEKKKQEEAEKKDEEKVEGDKPADEKADDEQKPAEEQQEEEEEEEIPPLRLNPNVFMKYKASTDDEEIAADEAAAREAAEYLQKIVIPAFIADVRRGTIAPADGYSLSELMHSCGINMRYLGRLASLCKRLETIGGVSKYMLELLEVEMVARATKHYLADVLNADESVRAAPGDAIVQVLNSILGSTAARDESAQSKKKSKKGSKSSGSKSDSADDSAPESPSNGAGASPFSATAVWQRLEKEIKSRFDYELSLWSQTPEGEAASTSAIGRVQRNCLLRRLCQRLGLRVVSRNYDFALEQPLSLADITGVVPVVKNSLPSHPLPQAKQLLERGRLHLSSGALSSAYELLQEASALLFQVCGAAHEDAALCSSSLATVLYHAGDVAGAIAQQQRALALYTQLEGIDYHDTAFAHANLALFLHANAQTDVAVAHMRRAIYLLEFCSGPHFPEISSLYFKMGMMCQDVGQITLALLCHRESLRRGELDRNQAANTLHQMALACGLAGGYREALAYEKKVYSLFKEAFGEEDPRVLESAKYMAKFTEKAVEGAKGRREVDAAAAADAIANELLEELEIKTGTDGEVAVPALTAAAPTVASNGKKKNRKSKSGSKKH